MLLGELLGHPYDSDRFQSSCVRQQLAKMKVVSFLKLVFDQDPIVGCRVLAEEVGAKRSDFLFLRLQFKFNANRLA